MSRSSRVPSLVVAGVASGVGKTTVATGIMGALVRRGLRVQPYKVGPDYIDPTYHTYVTSSPSRNLDSWMLPKEALAELYWRAVSRVDVAVIEGVMGLYDGRSGADEAGSTAQVAKFLQAPVVLVLDVGKMARSAAALVLGYQRFDPMLRLAGVVLNNVGSEKHRLWVQEAIETATGVPVVGWMPKREDLRLPERHLGLIPTVEGEVVEETFDRLMVQVAETMDLDRLMELARTAGSPPLSTESVLFPETPNSKRVALALAHDKAFNFYYQDSLDLLEAWGAELVPFSPLEDRSLPDGVSGVYLGGGFPELFARELSENAPMLASLRAAAARAMPIYAECGGLMYLSEGIADFEGHRYQMVGLVPNWSIMQRRKLQMGYLTVRARTTTPLASQGAELRGHEFHWSVLERPPEANFTAYEAVDQPGRLEGYCRGNLLASYVHLHFGTNPTLAPNFVAACERWEALQKTERLPHA